MSGFYEAVGRVVVARFMVRNRGRIRLAAALAVTGAAAGAAVAIYLAAGKDAEEA